MKISHKEVQLAEVGPRFEMKRKNIISIRLQHYLTSPPLIAYEIRQGTIEQTEAEREWVLSNYSRTAKKRSLLSGPNYRVNNDVESDASKKRARR